MLTYEPFLRWECVMRIAMLVSGLTFAFAPLVYAQSTTQPANLAPPLPAASAPAAAAETSATPSAADARVLVLPFTPAAGTNFAWVGRAVQQDLVADLSRSTRTAVDAPANVQPAADAAGAVAQGRQAGASIVVFGQFQSAGPSMRLTGQVLDVTTGRPVGGLTATGPADDLFPLEDQVAWQVLHALPAGWVTTPLPPQPAAGGAPASDTLATPAPLPGDGVSADAPGSSEYYSYTYPDYSAPRAYSSSYTYAYAYPYYWRAVPYYGPDVFYFYQIDHYHHHWNHDHGGWINHHGWDDFRRPGVPFAAGPRPMGPSLGARPMPERYTSPQLIAPGPRVSGAHVGPSRAGGGGGGRASGSQR